jgi:division protein CdvB (Snf7/Vps24/ESCRT-III family)
MLKNWDRGVSESPLHKITERFHRTALKEGMAQTVYRLELQKDKLEQAANRLKQHDQQLFEKIVEAEVVKDDARAAIYANECAEIRKMARIILLSQLAIEQVVLRLETIEEFGDVLTHMAPITGVIHSLKGKLSGIVPEVSYELGSIGEMLNGMMVEAGVAAGTPSTPEASSEESKKILQEAALVAEQRMKEKFPELPEALPSEGEKHLH